MSKKTPRKITVSKTPFPKVPEAEGIKEIKLSIVIPCYNESRRIIPLIEALKEFTLRWKKDYEIIIVDDGSTDNVVDIIRNEPFLNDLSGRGKFRHIVLEKNQGKGNALKEGVQEATGTHILTMDADLSYHPNEVLRWLDMRHGSFQDNEILLGSRLHKESENLWEKDTSKVGTSKVETSKVGTLEVRKFIGLIFNYFTRFMTSIKVSDNQSGFKLYPAAVAKYLFANMRIKGWAHDVEMLYLADLSGVDIIEMPVKCINREGSKINIIRDSFGMLFQTLFIALRIRWKYYIADPFRVWINRLGKDYIPPVSDKGKFRMEARFRFLFAILSIVLLFLMPMISKDYGISGDEWIQHEYGKSIYDYFFHGDKRAICDTEECWHKNYTYIRYYSGGYELLSAIAVKLFPQFPPFEVRHFLNAIIGFLAMFFTGLFAKRLGGWRAGFLALIFIALSPRFFGHSMNNSKDIPFAFAIIFTLYHMVPLLRQLPRPKLQNVLLVCLGIAMALNIRVGGFLLLGYLGLFASITYLHSSLVLKKFRFGIDNNLFRSIGIIIVIAVVTYFAGVLFWPYGQQDPFSNPIYTLREMTNFPITIQILFDGAFIGSGQVPWNYTLKWISYTTPDLIILLAFLFVPLIILLYRHYKTLWIWFLPFAVVFPVAYAIYQDSNLYDGWRHFLFIYPPLVIVAALTANFVLDWIRHRFGPLLIGGLIVLGLALPLKWMLESHPNQYVYFNLFYGGVQKAYANFETDYYMNSMKESFYQLVEMENLDDLEDTIMIASNTDKEIREYASEANLKIKSRYINYRPNWNRSERNWDYAVIFTRYLPQELLTSPYFPHQNAIYVNELKGVPLSIVLKRTSREDLHGYEALKANDPESAVRHFENYVMVDSTNEMVYGDLGKTYLRIGRQEDAIRALATAYRINPGDLMMRFNLVDAYIQGNKPQMAIDLMQPHITNAENDYRNKLEEIRKFRTRQMKNPNNPKLMQDLNMMNYQLSEAGKQLGQYYYMMAYAYNQMGNSAEAGKYMQLAGQYNPELRK